MADDDAAPTRYLHGHDDAVLRSHRQRSAENSCAYLHGRLNAGWGGLWAERLTQTRFAEQAAAAGLAIAEDLDDLAGAWHAWAGVSDACFIVPHGEVICTP
ncbi:MAG: hypothetical protein ACYDH5_02095 [Acidimicrobiales bacterium]